MTGIKTGEFDEDINQPMYATSIGLVLKGFEYIKNKKTPVLEQEEDPIDFSEETLEEKDAPKMNLFEKFKSTLNEIFAENDMKLE